MKRLIVALLTTALSLTSPVMAATLKRGDSSEQVRKLQQALIENGYLSGNADGQFGPMTEDAVKKCQEQVGVTVNGIVNDILYMNLTYETIDNSGKRVTDYDYSDWARFIKSYDETQVQEPTGSNFIINDYIGKRLSEFCEFNNGQLNGSDKSVELIFEAGNFGNKDAGLTIGSESDLANYTVVFQDPMPDMSVPLPEGECKIRLGVIDNRLPEFDGRVRHQMKNYVGKRVNEFGEREYYNYYDSYDEDRIFIPFWFEDGLRIAFAEGSILANYIVVEQKIPAGSEFVIARANDVPYGYIIKNIPLIIKEDIVLRNPVWENFPTVDGYVVGDVGGQTTGGTKYILNTNTKKIHRPSCRYVEEIAPENRESSNASIEQLRQQNYTECQVCHPT